MILDKLENAANYYESVPGLEQFMDFYAANDLESLPACKIKLDGDDGAVRPCEGVGNVGLYGKHIRRLQGIDLLSDAGLTAPGQDHIQFENILNMGLDAPDTPHDAAERTFLREAQNRIVFRHRNHLPSFTV